MALSGIKSESAFVLLKKILSFLFQSRQNEENDEIEIDNDDVL